FNKGYAKVRNSDRKWNFIDKNGKLLSDEWFLIVNDFEENFAKVLRKDKKWCLINKDGNLMLEE
ncbi:MAG: hypothetical protein N3A01_02015, partial [Bacteroidales bacterium]|nr:hypothetical protein [Bacteroidales bacterium]